MTACVLYILLRQDKRSWVELCVWNASTSVILNDFYTKFMNGRLKIFALISGFFFLLNDVNAQSVSSSNSEQLIEKEESLRILADSMINAVSPATRFRSDSNFIRSFVRALQTENSFYYPFESLATISRLYAPDSSFRIFTWQLKKDEYVFFQKGAIQMNTGDGSLKLFPLFDASMFTAKPIDSARSRNNWIGAIYYKIIQKEYNNKNYYTLLGFDDFSISSNKKWLEVLSFNNSGEPVFGGPLISFKEDTLKRPVQSRFNIEYKKEANTVFNYDLDLDMIIFDHLISESDEPERKNTYIPDGTYEGFKWKNGQWVHIDKVFDFKLEDGQFPVDASIRDGEGNIDEQKLEEASRKNMEKAGSNKPEPKKKPAKQ